MIMIGEVSSLVWLCHGIRLLYHDDIDAHKVEDRRHYFFRGRVGFSHFSAQYQLNHDREILLF